MLLQLMPPSVVQQTAEQAENTMQAGGITGLAMILVVIAWFCLVLADRDKEEK